MDKFEAALAQLKDYKMSPAEKRAQAIDFVAGNLMFDRPEYDEWLVRLWAAKTYDRKHEVRK